jgi:hypothetical protein
MIAADFEMGCCAFGCESMTRSRRLVVSRLNGEYKIMPDAAFRVMVIGFLVLWPLTLLVDLGWLQDLHPSSRGKVLRANIMAALGSYSGAAIATLLRRMQRDENALAAATRGRRPDQPSSGS